MRSTPVLVASAVLAGIAGVFHDPAFVSAVVVLWFFAVVPGTLLCRLVGFETPGVFGWVVVIATSFAVDTVVMEALLYTSVWTPARGLLALVALSLAAGAASRGRRGSDVTSKGNERT